jgi:hypothetical protein
MAINGQGTILKKCGCKLPRQLHAVAAHGLILPVGIRPQARKVVLHQAFDSTDNKVRCKLVSSGSHPGTGGIMSKSLRSQLYRAARDLGNVQAARKGPTGLAKRVVRRKVYRSVNGPLSRLLRALGI